MSKSLGKTIQEYMITQLSAVDAAILFLDSKDYEMTRKALVLISRNLKVYIKKIGDIEE